MRAVLNRLRRNDDTGITLVEMIVVMALSAIVMTLVATMLVQVAKVSTTSNDRARSTNVATNIMDAITTDVRAGVNIPATSTWAVRPGSEMTLTGERLRMITYSDVARPNPIGMPLQVAYTLESGNIVRYVWALPTDASKYPLATVPTDKRIIGGAVTALSISYVQSTCTAPATSPCSVTTVDSSNVALITAVRIDVTVRAEGSTVPVSMTSTIYMPNAGSVQKYAGS